MKIIPVTRDNTADYVSYCRRHGAEHDESFLPNDAFAVTDAYPAYLLVSEGEVIGAIGLMRTQPYVDKGKVRLTIFHATRSEPEAYVLLLEAIRKDTEDLRFLYGFLPEAKSEARRCWEALGFEVERFAYLLAYHSDNVTSCSVPEGYRLMKLERTDEVGLRQLCDLWNRNYGHQPGFVGADPKHVVAWFDEPETIPGGTLLLMHGTTPVGTAWIARDDEDVTSADVSMLSVHPDYRGQGLGRWMLRNAVAVALRNDLSPVYLSVNAANETAAGLYLSEGFVKDKVMVCYTLDVS